VDLRADLVVEARSALFLSEIQFRSSKPCTVTLQTQTRQLIDRIVNISFKIWL